MGGNYEKGVYNQLMEVMARLDVMEHELHAEKREHKEDVERLNKKIDGLTHENQLLRDDNARLRSIINNDSSNTSLPPSTDKKGGKPANTYNGRKKPNGNAADKRDIKEPPLAEPKRKKKSEAEDAGMRSGIPVMLPAGNMSQNMWLTSVLPL